MKPASLNEIKKQLKHVDTSVLEELCLRLARYKKENKELLTYLLFEANDEQAYIRDVKLEMEEFFETLPNGNVYFIKKAIRKIMRYVNKQIRYSGLPATELEIRIYFCQRMLSGAIPLKPGTVLYNLYQQQLKKIQAVWSKLPEDLQFDYARDLQSLQGQG